MKNGWTENERIIITEVIWRLSLAKKGNVTVVERNLTSYCKAFRHRYSTGQKRIVYWLCAKELYVHSFSSLK